MDKERTALTVWGLAGHSACRNLFLVRVGVREKGRNRTLACAWNTHPCQTVALEHPGPVFIGSTAQGSNTMANGTNGL